MPVSRNILDEQISATQGSKRNQNAYQPHHTDKSPVFRRTERSGNHGEIQRLNDQPEPLPEQHPTRVPGQCAFQQILNGFYFPGHFNARRCRCARFVVVNRTRIQLESVFIQCTFAGKRWKTCCGDWLRSTTGRNRFSEKIFSVVSCGISILPRTHMRGPKEICPPSTSVPHRC